LRETPIVIQSINKKTAAQLGSANCVHNECCCIAQKKNFNGNNTTTRERENGKCIMSYFPHRGCAATTFDEGTALYKNNAHQKIEIFSFFPK
jgi:hypothetical protein